MTWRFLAISAQELIKIEANFKLAYGQMEETLNCIISKGRFLVINSVISNFTGKINICFPIYLCFAVLKHNFLLLIIFSNFTEKT